MNSELGTRKSERGSRSADPKTTPAEMRWQLYNFWSPTKKANVTSKALVPVGAKPSEMIAAIRHATGMPNLQVELLR